MSGECSNRAGLKNVKDDFRFSSDQNDTIVVASSGMLFQCERYKL